MVKTLKLLFAAIVIGTLTACGQPETLSDEDAMSTALALVTAEALPTPGPPPSPTPQPPRVLTVCMGQEPTSLFPYGDASAAAMHIRQAIYDGPLDVVNGDVQPVILEQIPSLENGDALLRPVDVRPGDIIVDASGNWVALGDGVLYRPSGCSSLDCAQVYTGDQPVQMDELVVRFRLLPGILWSDGAPLTANDSVYAYDVARVFYGNALGVLRYTQAYTALDDLTVEWVAVPGYQGAYAMNFFSPLPKHLWEQMRAEEMLSAELTTRYPLGWGPYVLTEWIRGDHLTLSRNERYFRAAEGLPYFDNLVFRFVPDGDAAVDALLVGECDLVDPTALSRQQIQRLLDVQSQGRAQVRVTKSASFEQLVFGIDSLNPDNRGVFASTEVRQAVAMCIDRQALVDQLYFGTSAVPDGYLLPEHTLAAEGLSHYEFDPEAALELLSAQGWVDFDQDMNTPLTSLGAPGFPDGTPLTFTYLVPDDSERQAAAQIVQASLAQCGIQTEVQVLPWDEFLLPGPDGAVFGRLFDLAQFAWAESQTPLCNLFVSTEIPGPYPDFPKGWGGGNLAGFSNPEFDQACQTAQTSLPDGEAYRQAHQQAQRIFAEELPVVPLYWHVNVVAARPELCLDDLNLETLVNLAAVELVKLGEGCSQ